MPRKKINHANHPLIRILLVLALSVSVSLLISRLGVGSERASSWFSCLAYSFQQY